jgi:serine/threonine protein kinase
MTLSTGTKLAHYEITSQIGKGGMGEVYQAKDTKLGRDVAIKVLPEEFARDTERVARFHREAKLLASLNHPNIAAIYGLEESDETHFLVLELVEGDTLADRLKRGSIPVEEALKLALQMAEALEAAHEKGVIHRDLKPANIKVTPDGKVKVLDFGLAKAFTGDQGDVNPADSPTITAGATQRGVILGTAGYMSPEQARGEPVDQKADIWAFGVVLFEMLIGRQVFTGRTVSDTLASVLAREPEWNGLPPNLHPRIRFLLERCLKKESNNRYSGISDARVDIQEVLDDPSGVFAQPGTKLEPQRNLRTILPWITLTAIICLFVVGVAVWFMKPSEPRQVMRFDYQLPNDQIFSNITRKMVAISPDGTLIVYAANQQLYLKNINQWAAKPIPGTKDNPSTPFFSPDSKYIGYWSQKDMQLKKISVSGGLPVKLCDAGWIFGANWGTDDKIFFGQASGIMSVSANGGAAETVISGEQNVLLSGPQVMPGGDWILFTKTPGPDLVRWDEAQIIIQSLKNDDRKVLIHGGIDARYIPTGHLIYAKNDGNLYVTAFNGDRLARAGEENLIIEDVYLANTQYTGAGDSSYSISETGIIIYVPSKAPSSLKRNLVWVDRDGKEELLSAPSNSYQNPRISPDGNRVVVSAEVDENMDIYIWDLNGKAPLRRITNDPAEDSSPLWTIDGKQIVFISRREGSVGIYLKNADGMGDVKLVSSVSNRGAFLSSWSADGKEVVLEEYLDDDKNGISTVSIDGEHKKKILLEEDFIVANPHVSPNGQWMAYLSWRSGSNNIWVRSFPEVNTFWREISAGKEPKWSPDGKELYYRSGQEVGEGFMMVVAVKPEPVFESGIPKELFRDTYFSARSHNWDFDPEGKRFLMLKNAVSDDSTSETPRKINVVLNWFEELKEKVPVK